VNGQRHKRSGANKLAAATSTQPFALRVYVGPKDYDDLKKMNPPLQGHQFGWLNLSPSPCSRAEVPATIKRPQWGWAVVVLTLVIKHRSFFPLRISSYKTTVKMQRVPPEIKPSRTL